MTNGCICCTLREDLLAEVFRLARERRFHYLLIDQVKFADVIVLNKLDLVTEDRAREVEAILRTLNPGAEIHQATRGQVPLERVLDTGLFDDDENWRGVLRSKGFFWVAANHRVAYEWTQAGGVSSVNPMGMWLAAVPREDWEHADGQRPDQQPSWHPRYGDRHQALVFIGQHVDEAALRARLDACLLDGRMNPPAPAT